MAIRVTGGVALGAGSSEDALASHLSLTPKITSMQKPRPQRDTPSRITTTALILLLYGGWRFKSGSIQGVSVEGLVLGQGGLNCRSH